MLYHSFRRNIRGTATIQPGRWIPVYSRTSRVRRASKVATGRWGRRGCRRSRVRPQVLLLFGAGVVAAAPLSPPPPPAGRSSRSRSPRTRTTPSSLGCRAHRRATRRRRLARRTVDVTQSRWSSIGTARRGRSSRRRYHRPAGGGGSRLCRAPRAARASPSAFVWRRSGRSVCRAMGRLVLVDPAIPQLG